MELSVRCKGISAKICVITGWQLPEDTEYIHIFEDQLKKMLVDEYQNLNVDELDYAMRNHGTVIKDWGKAMNLSLVREALDSYLSSRAELSRLEENVSRETESPNTPMEVVDWTDTLKSLKRGEIIGSIGEMIPYASIYDWAEKTGLLCPNSEAKWEFMSIAREIMINLIKEKKSVGQATVDDRQLMERLRPETWRRDKIAVLSLISLTKELIVKDYINENKNKL
jgi:hypothetical protein